ncbi:MAG: hypothetical protein AAGN46_01270 [Acidobacteriota bacterium]
MPGQTYRLLALAPIASPRGAHAVESEFETDDPDYARRLVDARAADLIEGEFPDERKAAATKAAPKK